MKTETMFKKMKNNNQDSYVTRTSKKIISIENAINTRGNAIKPGLFLLFITILILIIPIFGYSLLTVANDSVNNLANTSSNKSMGNNPMDNSVVNSLSNSLGTSIGNSLSSSLSNSIGLDAALYNPELSGASSSDVPSGDVSSTSNTDLTTIISMSNIYYNQNDLVDIYVRNTTSIFSSGDLSMEISILEDPTYSFRYLGSLGDKVSFIPEKSGTYIIRLYSIMNDSYTLVAEKYFYVYDAKSYDCKNYAIGSLININLKSYDYYATRPLPDSLTLVYTDYDNNSQIFVYSNKIIGVVEYKFTKPGRYALFSEGIYLDCFSVNETDSVSQNLNGTSMLDNSSNSSSITNTSSFIISSIVSPENISSDENLLNLSLNNQSTNQSTVQINSQNETLQNSFLSGDRQAIYYNFYSENASRNFDFAKDMLLDIRAFSNGVVIAEISRNNTFGPILELWSININTGETIRLAFNESAPSSSIRPGIKDGVLFWVSEFNDRVYAYDTASNLTMYRNLPSYDLSKGEIGRVSFNDTAINNGWDVLVDGSQVYFYNSKEGEVFSDDNSDIKEQFRSKMNLDKYFSSDELSQLSLQVNQADNNANYTNANDITQGENSIAQQ